eukprot:c20220_g1_i2.p1 GENE.c20220_g1_i2~~c20220_g1_i2.p1  ORF type:complete len:558 (-),score=202.99 c20220_g1_i2:31-1683(-)
MSNNFVFVDDFLHQTSLNNYENLNESEKSVIEGMESLLLKEIKAKKLSSTISKFQTRKDFKQVFESIVPQQLVKLNTLIKQTHNETVRGLETEVDEICSQTHMPNEEKRKIEAEMNLNGKSDFFFSDVQRCHVITTQLRESAKLRNSVISSILSHEKLILEAIKLEKKEKNKVKSKRAEKLGSDITESFLIIHKTLENYKSVTNREFSLNGTEYKSFLEKQEEQKAALETDFEDYTTEFLYFYNKNDDSISSNITKSYHHSSSITSVYGFACLAHIKNKTDNNNSQASQVPHNIIEEEDDKEEDDKDEKDDGEHVLVRNRSVHFSSEHSSSVFFIFKNNNLNYFEIDPLIFPKGKFPLEGSKVQLIQSSVPGALYPPNQCFKCICANRTYFFFTESIDRRDYWMKLIQKQIDKLEKNKEKGEKKKLMEEEEEEAEFELQEQVKKSIFIGFLTKSGGTLNLSWKKRMIVLTPTHLSYFSPPPGLKMKGNFEITNFRKVPNNQRCPPGFTKELTFILETKKSGNLYFCPPDQKEKERWTKGFSQSCGQTKSK